MVMTRNTGSGAPILAPETVHNLLIRPLFEASVAAQVCNIVTITTSSVRFPVVTRDPIASWVNEGQEINPSDIVLDEIDVVPGKLAGLTFLTRELADDSNPEAAQVVGDGLARDLARKLDAAAFGPTAAAPAPSGLEALTGRSKVSAGTAWTDLDAFAEGAAAVETEAAELSAWVAAPSTVLALAKLRQGQGSNVPLLSPDPTQPARRLIEGRPLLVSAAVKPGKVWGIAGDRTHVVVREDPRIETDFSVAFTSDRLAIRAVLRAGFGFPHPASVVEVALTSA